MRYTLKLFAFTSLAILVLSIGMVQAQTQGVRTNPSNHSERNNAEFQFSNLLAQARSAKPSWLSLMTAGGNANTSRSAFTVSAPTADPNLSVVGSGTVGRLTKWTSFTVSKAFIKDSTMFEDTFGKVGIGTDSPTSRLTVMGLIESSGSGGGFKFADGTIQTTAGISFVTRDASLAGLGTAASPLGIAAGGVQPIHLANGSVTAPKIAAGIVVRSLNGLVDNVNLVAGANITITPSGGNTLTVAAPAALTTVAHDATLTGNGTPLSPLSVAVATAAEQPFQRAVQVPLPDGELVAENAFFVPSDKRLVIEFASAVGAVPSGQTIFRVQIITSVGGEEVAHYLVPVRVAIGGVGFSDRFVSSQQMVVHADAGTLVRVLVARDEAVNSAVLSLTVSGHLVNVP